MEHAPKPPHRYRWSAILPLMLIAFLLAEAIYFAQKYGTTTSSLKETSLVRPIEPVLWPPKVVWVSSRPLPLITPQDVLDNYSLPDEFETTHTDVVLSPEQAPRNISLVDPSIQKPKFSKPPKIFFETDLTKYREAPNIKIHFAILTCPMMVYSRLLPLLNTSMLHADGVDVFIRRTGHSYAVVNLIMDAVKQIHPHPDRIRVLELDGPNNEDLYKVHAKSNSWADLEIMRYWGQELEETGEINQGLYTNVSSVPLSEQNRTLNNLWFSIIDDDGYAFINNAKMLIASEQHHLLAEQNAHDVAPVPLLPPLLMGSHMVATIMRRYFVNGGPGLYFNYNALVTTLPYVTPWGDEQIKRKKKKSKKKRHIPGYMDLTKSHLERIRVNKSLEGQNESVTYDFFRPLSTSAYGSTCVRRYGKVNGGDTRLSLCLTDGGPWDGRNGTMQPGVGAWLFLKKNSYFDTPMRAIGEVKYNWISTFPVGFHRLRERSWLFRLNRIEALRREEFLNNPNSTVLPLPITTWGDIESNFVVGASFFDSQFYPRKYANYTEIYFSLPQRMVRSLNKRKNRPLDADPW